MKKFVTGPKPDPEPSAPAWADGYTCPMARALSAAQFAGNSAAQFAGNSAAQFAGNSAPNGTFTRWDIH